MTIVWPEALPLLRAQQAHWNRRLDRIEQVATDGDRIDWTMFPEWRAYVQGKADAYDEMIELVEGSRKPTLPFDMAMIALAQAGLDPERIAARCGVTVLEVAESLARYAAAAHENGGAS